MKKTIVLLAVGLLTHRITQAQGTVYLSNLGQTSAGSLAVGSNSWVAALFGTGTNSGGYLLDSVQLALADASGNPSGFTVMIYNLGLPRAGAVPGSNLGTLTGSLSPTTAGTYIYTPTSSLTLSPSTTYFVVLTAGTAVADGAYEWSQSVNPPNASDGWGETLIIESSNNGLSWQAHSGDPQFAITATAIPEPCILGLFTLGGLFFGLRRWENLPQ
jgi:hypothetical protein